MRPASQSDATISIGEKNMNKAKFRELVVYIARQSERDPRFGAVKLNKILYYADFAAHRQLGRSITGDEYQNLGEGPAPRHLLEVRDSLIRDGSVTVESKQHYGRMQARIVASREPVPTSLPPEEKRIIDRVLDELWPLNGSEA